MPVTPNYAFEKRQRELAKKKKLEEKKSRKRDAAASMPDTPPPDAAAPGTGSDVDPERMPVTASPPEQPRIHRKRSP